MQSVKSIIRFIEIPFENIGDLLIKRNDHFGKKQSSLLDFRVLKPSISQDFA